MERALVNVEDLAMFVRVVDSGGVTRAADALHVAQPAVTQRLRRLELLACRSPGGGDPVPGARLEPRRRELQQAAVAPHYHELALGEDGRDVLGEQQAVAAVDHPDRKRRRDVARAEPGLLDPAEQAVPSLDPEALAVGQLVSGDHSHRSVYARMSRPHNR